MTFLCSDEPEGIKSRPKKTTMLVLAVTLHNIAVTFNKIIAAKPRDPC